MSLIDFDVVIRVIHGKTPDVGPWPFTGKYSIFTFQLRA